MTLKTLKEVAIVSLFGAIASIILVVSIVILGIQDYSSHSGIVVHSFVNWQSLALAMGTLAFSFGGNFVYPEVEHSMRNPHDFPKVLKNGMILITGKLVLLFESDVFTLCNYWLFDIWEYNFKSYIRKFTCR